MTDRGSASVELVLLTPVIVVLALFVVYAGRAGTVVEQVRHAADQGARAASLLSAPRQRAAAEGAVLNDLRRSGVGCVEPVTRLAANRSGRVATVTVTVTCAIDILGLSLLGVGQRRVSATSTEPIDVYRGGS